MKKTQVVFGLLMMISSVAFAGGIEDPSPFSGIAILKNGALVRVLYKADKPTKVKVAIFDERNQLVFSEDVKKRSEFIRPYNLSNLPEGEYRIVVEDENNKEEENIHHVKEQSKVLSSVIHAKEKQQCLVTLFSKGEASVKITLTDSNRKVLATESYSTNGQSSRLFDLKDVKGPVYVEVSDKQGTIQSKVIE